MWYLGCSNELRWHSSDVTPTYLFGHNTTPFWYICHSFNTKNACQWNCRICYTNHRSSVNKHETSGMYSIVVATVNITPPPFPLSTFQWLLHYIETYMLSYRNVIKMMLFLRELYNFSSVSKLDLLYKILIAS